MKTFAVIISCAPDYVARRAPYRQEHLQYLGKLRDQGVVRMAGAWADPVDGVLIIVDANSADEVRQIVEQDPYHQAGLWPSVQVREWLVVVS